ncbi:hypothetical protein DA718_14475 [Klebsiella huaxiensis]|uniref:Uncharacterized protein n=1 Tax=Klebsiella huaxiensis TaxID=2153354 RepID=A0ABT6EDM2_9ENTR|nr:hypothetical protein [Klebsiella huaxiensis]MDG1643295.1 hypothetical protein [Klebsiella huaxiensis]QBG08313.1 hypothetical protein DA718_14475 [Klebsiella huaxiensis]
MPFSARLQLFIDKIIDALRARPLTQEILAMEVSSPNVLTEILNVSLERWGLDVKVRLAEGYPGDVEKLNIIITTLFAGIQYFMLKSRSPPPLVASPFRRMRGGNRLKKVSTGYAKK